MKKFLAGMLLLFSAVNVASAEEEFRVDKDAAFIAYDLETGEIVEELVFSPRYIFGENGACLTLATVCEEGVCVEYEFEKPLIFEQINPDNFILGEEL